MMMRPSATYWAKAGKPMKNISLMMMTSNRLPESASGWMIPGKGFGDGRRNRAAGAGHDQQSHAGDDERAGKRDDDRRQPQDGDCRADESADDGADREHGGDAHRTAGKIVGDQRGR